jgi:hypothetical protein
LDVWICCSFLMSITPQSHKVCHLEGLIACCIYRPIPENRHVVKNNDTGEKQT